MEGGRERLRGEPAGLNRSGKERPLLPFVLFCFHGTRETS